MRKPRILFINHAGVMGGGEICLLELARAYKDSCEVLLLENGPLSKNLTEEGIKVEVLPTSESILSIRTSSGWDSLQSIPALLGMAHQIPQIAQKFDFIHANSQKAFIVAALARLMRTPPLIWHLRDIITASHFSSLNRRVAVTLANLCAHRVFVNSKATGEAFVAAGGKKELVKPVYEGFSLDVFCSSQAHCSRSIRQELGIGNVPLVGLFSRLSYWKGQHILLQALEKLPGVHALLVGDTLFGEVEYTTQLKTLAAQPALKGRVHWLGFRRDVPQLMAACDFIVHTSTEPEPFGRVIVEGQLARKPVIATAGGGALELVKHGVTGYLVPPGDASQLAQTIAQLLAHPTTTEVIAQQGYLYAREHFSLETHLKSFAQALEIA